MNSKFLALICAVLIIPLFAKAETKVDIELVLAADFSNSMSGSVSTLQRRGYAAALRSPEIARALTSGPRRRVALTYLEWGDSGRVQVVVPWTLIEKPEDAIAIARKLEVAPMQQFSKTSISHALRFANGMFARNGYSGTRRVIDLSGNGPNNQGRSVGQVRDEVVASGTIINGLPIMTRLDRPRGAFGTGFDLRDLDLYFMECVIGGEGAFVLPVHSEADLARTLHAKLFLEISGLTPNSVIDAKLHRVAFGC